MKKARKEDVIDIGVGGGIGIAASQIAIAIGVNYVAEMVIGLALAVTGICTWFAVRD